MSPGPPVRRIPWGRIAVVLAAAMFAAWMVGFLAGTIVRFVAGARLS